MARRALDPGEEFSLNDLAIASGLSKRAIQLVDERGLLPAGRGIKALKRVAVIGALETSGIALLLASRIAAGLVEYDFNEIDGEVPTGLRHAVLAVSPEGLAELGENTGDYWYHRALLADARRRHGAKNDYVLEFTWRADAIVELVNGQHLFLRQGFPVLNPITGSTETATYLGRIKNLQRGTDPSIDFYPIDSSVSPSRAAENFAAATSARGNAVSILSVNVSLACRLALTRLAVARRKQVGISE